MTADAQTAIARIGEFPSNRPRYFAISGDPTREYFAFCPPTMQPGTPALVAIHGISRNAAEHLVRFAPLAERLGVPLIAPLFEASAYGAYQRLVDPKNGIRADLALIDIVEDAARRWGFDADRFHLFGFSGGSQFAHRFAFVHPERVITCVGASAGWYTWPTDDRPYPEGMRSHPIEGDAFDLPAIRKIPFHVLVGKRDTERDAALRKGRRIDALQGINRVERARRWARAMASNFDHPAITLTELPRTGHNFDRAQQQGLCRIVFSMLGYSDAIAKDDE